MLLLPRFVILLVGGITTAAVGVAIPAVADNYHIRSGDLTWYETGLGSCGQCNTNDDAIAAVSHALYDSMSFAANPNYNPICGRRIRLWSENNRDKVVEGKF